jgi:hypothetical protein
MGEDKRIKIFTASWKEWRNGEEEIFYVAGGAYGR